MRLFNQSALRKLCTRHADARASLNRWNKQVQAAAWSCQAEVVQTSTFKPSPVGDDRIVFNIGGNNYRLIVRVDFTRRCFFLHWFGTHADYDAIHAATVPRNL